jgi:hypothetical protein
MNMANTQNEDQEFDYRADFDRKAKDGTPKARKIQYARKGSAPTSHNGIHRRRNKRFSW